MDIMQPLTSVSSLIMVKDRVRVHVRSRRFCGGVRVTVRVRVRVTVRARARIRVEVSVKVMVRVTDQIMFCTLSSMAYQ